LSKTWRTIVVLGFPAVVAIGFSLTLGAQLDASIKASDIPFFGGKASISALGATALYIIVLLAANRVYPIDAEDDLMPLRHKLKGKYKFKLPDGQSVIEGHLLLEIDGGRRRLSIHGETKNGNALSVQRRIILREEYLGFVIDVVPVGKPDESEAKYFIECELAANEKKLMVSTNKWYRLDGDGYGSIAIEKQS
jgi:hypothetical protein